MQNEKDKALWEKAQARASFKRHLFSYVVINLFLNIIWFISSRPYTSYYWPIWPLFGWGIGLLMHYFGAFHADRIFSAEKEYEKLNHKS